MSNDFFGNKLIEVLLSWFQYLVNSIVALLSGSEGGGFIKWLSNSWLGILFVLLICGSVINVSVYVIRWRPHWWWFAKKRMVVDDALVERKKKPAPKARTQSANPSGMFEAHQKPSKKKDLFDSQSGRNLMEPSRKRK